MPQFRKLALLCVSLISFISLFGVTFAHAEKRQTAEHSYISCAMITSEYLTALQLYQRGVTLDTAQTSLPKVSRKAKQRLSQIYQLAENIGILNAYADINTNYSRCADKVFKQLGTPAHDQLEYGYYFCAGENKRRFEIILYSDRYMNLDKVVKKVADTHLSVAIQYFQLIEKEGLLAAFDYTANNLKACLGNLRAL